MSLSRKEEHHKYINSPIWKIKRAEAFAHHGRACAACGSTEDLDMHHISYLNLSRKGPGKEKTRSTTRRGRLSPFRKRGVLYNDGWGVWVSGGRLIPRGHWHRSRTLAQLHAPHRGSMCSYPKKTNHCNKNTWPFPQCQG